VVVGFKKTRYHRSVSEISVADVDLEKIKGCKTELKE